MEKDGLQSFSRTGIGVWVTQQGLTFLSPERVLVYQVNRRGKPPSLSERTLSGGGGSFFLIVKVFDARTGREVRRMEVPTSSDYSIVLPMRDGRFLIRAGNFLGLYSQDFALLASRELPLVKAAPLDYWQAAVTPSGKQAVLVHQQVFEEPEFDENGQEAKAGKTEADVEMLDADTLKTIKTLHLPYYLPAWSAEEGFLLAPNPKRPASKAEFGTIDFAGRWSLLHPAWAKPAHDCYYEMDLLDHERVVARGCDAGLVVFSETGEKFLALPPKDWQKFVSTAGSGHYLAVEINERVVPVDRPPNWQQWQLQVYDLESRQCVLSVRLPDKKVQYALSTEGLLAVLYGDQLDIYGPD